MQANLKAMWRSLKRVIRNNTYTPCQASQVEIETYYKKMYKKKKINKKRYQQLAQQTYKPIDKLQWAKVLEPVSMAEVLNHWKRHPNTAAGLDNISAQTLIHLPIDIQEEIRQYLDDIIQNKKKIPPQWYELRTQLIHKKCSANDPANFRPITVQNVLCRTLWTIISARMTMIIEENNCLPSQQYGFRPHVHIKNATSILAIIAELVTRYFLICLDLQKAYDSVPHELVQCTLQQIQVPANICQLINDMYTNSQTQVWTNQGFTKKIRIDSGILQGVSPTI